MRNNVNIHKKPVNPSPFLAPKVCKAPENADICSYHRNSTKTKLRYEMDVTPVVTPGVGVVKQQMVITKLSHHKRFSICGKKLAANQLEFRK